MNKPLEVREGWQFEVELYDTYVIRRRKNLDETCKTMRKNARRYRFLPKYFLKKQASKVLNNIDPSIRILQESKINPAFFANPQFLENGGIKQTRVVGLRTYLSRVGESEARKIADKLVEFYLFLWQHGIHESSLNIAQNYGVYKGEIILFDFFELSDSIEDVRESMRKKEWIKPWYKKCKLFSKDFLDYYYAKIEKVWTEENIQKNWKKH